MGGTQDEFFEVNLLQNPRVLRNLVEHPDASIDHRISGDVNSAKNILLYKNFAVAVRWSEENVRQMIRYSPILLFGHVWIVATGPGLDMEERNTLTTREERAGENRICVTNDDEVCQALLATEGIESGQQECELASV